MKKSLLTISATLLASLAAGAAGPQLLTDTYAMGISPNGQWGSSSFYGYVSIINLTNGDAIYIEQEAETGNGNNIANNGTLVMSVYDQAYIVVNGETRVFDQSLAENYPLTWLNGITPDATRIVGTYTPKVKESEMNNFPALWEVDANGNPTKMIELPYPTVDFTGRCPQSANAIGISADGKTVVGHFVDYSGSYVQPIIYTEAEDGTWSYKLPADELLNPDHLVFPEDPGESPEPPVATDFMTEEESAAYDEALQEYFQTWDESLFPDIADYMTAEEAAEYNKAVDAYNDAAKIYNDKLEAFYDVFNQLNGKATNFIYNNMNLSPDGKTVAAGAQIVEGEDFWSRTVYNYTIVINVEHGECTKLPTTNNVYPNQALNNGVILGVNATAMGGLPPQAYIKLPENDDYISFADYLKANNTAAYDWINENLLKEIELFDMDTYEPYTEEFLFTGLAWMSDDLNTVFSGVQSSYWGDEDPSEMGVSSYIINDLTAGVSNVVAGGANNIKISAARGGQINIAGDATRVTVYDLTGRTVFSAPAAATIATGLNGGAYIVKVDSANGSKTAKVTF